MNLGSHQTLLVGFLAVLVTASGCARSEPHHNGTSQLSSASTTSLLPSPATTVEPGAIDLRRLVIDRVDPTGGYSFVQQPAGSFPDRLVTLDDIVPPGTGQDVIRRQFQQAGFLSGYSRQFGEMGGRRSVRILAYLFETSAGAFNFGGGQAAEVSSERMNTVTHSPLAPPSFTYHTPVDPHTGTVEDVTIFARGRVLTFVFLIVPNTDLPVPSLDREVLIELDLVDRAQGSSAEGPSSPSSTRGSFM